jgi:hypothetical protein
MKFILATIAVVAASYADASDFPKERHPPNRAVEAVDLAPLEHHV